MNRITRKIKLSGNNHKNINAMIVVENTKTRIFRHVPEKHIPKTSFLKDYGGLWLHVLGLTAGEFWPILRPAPQDGRTPTDLYVAKHCANEVNEVYGMSMPLSQKIAIGLLVGLCFGILIVLFLIVSASGGLA